MLASDTAGTNTAEVQHRISLAALRLILQPVDEVRVIHRSIGRLDGHSDRKCSFEVSNPPTPRLSEQDVQQQRLQLIARLEHAIFDPVRTKGDGILVAIRTRSMAVDAIRIPEWFGGQDVGQRIR